MAEVSFFVPVYNGESSVKQNLHKMYDFLNKGFRSFELIVVDDNSKDNSRKIIKEFAKNKKAIKLIEFEKGPTRRENLAQSFLQAKGNIVVFLDLDSIQSLSAIPELVEEIRKGEDIALGSRYVKGSRIKRRISRRLMSLLYNKFIQFYFNSKIRDHNCGIKAFKRKKLIELVKELGYDASLSRGWFWDAELLIRAQKKGMKIIELPVVWHEQRKSSFSLMREIKMVPYIFSFKKKFGKE
ncbi:MAG: glycosyltransferase [Candidatus Diapherotrites archaeon]